VAAERSEMVATGLRGPRTCLKVYKTELYVVPALYLLINRQDGGHGMLASLQATILASDAWNMGCGWREGGREVGRGSI
jgi:hypothetical protein